jgi:hypothetical protein
MRLMTSSNCALALTRSSCCFGQKLMALLGLLVFLNGHEVDRADFIEPFLQRLDLLRDGVPIRAAPLAAISSGVSVCTLAGPSSA